MTRHMLTGMNRRIRRLWLDPSLEGENSACGSFYRGSGLDTAAEEMRRMYVKRRALPLLLRFGFLLSPCLTYGQDAVTPFEKLPDWSGLWSMMGGTVFDTSTQTGKGGVVTPGVREHPPYTSQFEKIYEEHLALRDANRYPDVITNCGVPVGYPRILNLPDAYEFVVRPDIFYIVTENHSPRLPNRGTPYYVTATPISWLTKVRHQSFSRVVPD